MKIITMKKLLILLALMIPSLASAATLSVSPSSQTVNAGDTFSVTVQLDTQGTSVDGVDLKYLKYNPALLQVQDADSAKPGVQITPGSLMTATLLNRVDNSLGRIAFSQVVTGGSKYKGSGTLATVSFKAIAGGKADLTFDYTPRQTTDSNIAAGGVDILNAVINGSYTLKGTAPTGTVPPPNTKKNDTQNDVQTKKNQKNPSVSKSVVADDEDIDRTLVKPSQKSLLESIYDIFKYIISRIKSGLSKLLEK